LSARWRGETPLFDGSFYGLFLFASMVAWVVRVMESEESTGKSETLVVGVSLGGIKVEVKAR